MNAIAGSAGLLPSVWALNSGKDLALANKETIVMAGRLIMDIARQNGKKLLPVDSEHSALFNLIERFGKNNIQELIITASGGAFRNDAVSSLKDKNPLEALKHPTWNMGPKITIDSASMANKGLEVIEAARLFEMNAAEIKVLIHPESRVHSLVRSIDGSLYAQISKPDMRLAILNALSWPLVLKESLANLDLTDSSLNFSSQNQNATLFWVWLMKHWLWAKAFVVAYNAANEVAVEAFIKGKIRFIDIFRIVELTLGTRFPENIDSIEEAMESDKLARALAVKGDLMGLFTILLGLIGLGVVVFVHELGHFGAAKITGVEVEEFSLGWGPRLLSRQFGKTRYSISVLPIGGYCRMKGENAFREAIETGQEHIPKEPGSYYGATPGKRSFIAISGPLMNIIFAFLAYFFIMSIGYDIKSWDTKILLASDFDANTYPADEAGLKSGDRILKLNNKKVDNFFEIQEVISMSANKELDAELLRNGQLLTMKLEPSLDKESGAGQLKLSLD
ncbi:hypothetical protein MASR2M29_23340 [Spirochaetota bacterium]